MNDQNATSRMCGLITGLYGDVLQGWALDPSKPALRLVVEVFIDGHSVGFAKANEFHPGADGGDEFNGFALQLRESWLSTAKTISARIANQEKWLEGTVHLPAPSPADPAPAASQVWHTGGLKVSGWAFDPTDPNRAVTVTVREGINTVATVTADHLHHALAYKASRHHGFEIDLPWVLADGKLHNLEVLNDRGQPLSGSPLQLCCWPEGIESLVRSNGHTRLNTHGDTLLATVARHQEVLLPKSAGFEHYPEWFEVFQAPAPAVEGTPLRCGVMIITDGNNTLETITQSSVANQRAEVTLTVLTHEDDITAAINKLEAQKCDAIIPVMAGDRLSPYAVDQLMGLMTDGVIWGYGDCDCDGINGERTSPWLKPIWDIDLFLGADIFTPGAVIRTEAIKSVFEHIRKNTQPARISWLDFVSALAFFSETSGSTVGHLPRVVYHRHTRLPRSPVGAERNIKREKSIGWLVQNLVPGSTVKPNHIYPALLVPQWAHPQTFPKVTLMIPTRDRVDLLRTCVEGVLKSTNYPNLEIIIVDNDSTEDETLQYFDELQTRGVRVLPHPHAFNYPAVNNRAAEVSTGELVCLLNNDIEIIDSNWLTELVKHCLRPNIDVVGAKLLWSNGMVQHGGVVIGINGLAAHAGNNLEDRDPGYLGNNQITHRRTAVTGACMLLTRELYLKHRGMDEFLFPVAFNDVDLCLRITESGGRILWVASSKLIHAESASRGKDISAERRSRAKREQDYFIRKWSVINRSDPFYHPSLSHDYLTGPYSGLALPPTNNSIRYSYSVLTSTEQREMERLKG
ncbi:glycosyltransferase family 2 protein [Pseudomonas coleopterorum]|uniref:glycosyltransferase family 2 protein n=1 Tax=Pseudomonas coleopterorum TaxID=1605838 RepID=UPI0008997546|nr:glycosyltransferase [Pseudomonas coleopterorum]SEE34989.1 Glycosyltransferase, GT2 family [Pseudomonas coleopterorum]